MGRGLPRGRGVGALDRRLEAPLAQAQDIAEPIEPGPATTSGAVLALLLAALSFSLMTVCVKGAGHRLPVAEVVLARALVSLVLSWWMLRRVAINPGGRRRRLLAPMTLPGHQFPSPCKGIPQVRRLTWDWRPSPGRPTTDTPWKRS